MAVLTPASQIGGLLLRERFGRGALEEDIDFILSTSEDFMSMNKCNVLPLYGASIMFAYSSWFST